MAGGYDTAIDEVDGVKIVHVDDDTGRQPLAAVARRLADEASAARSRLAAREREVLERFLLRELADEVRGKLLDAHDLVRGTNRTLAGVHTSHGKGARLDWSLRDDAAAPAAVAARLLVDELRGDDGDAELRERCSRSSTPSGPAIRAPATSSTCGRRSTTGSGTASRCKVTDSADPGSARCCRLGWDCRRASSGSCRTWRCSPPRRRSSTPSPGRPHGAAALAARRCVRQGR